MQDRVRQWLSGGLALTMFLSVSVIPISRVYAGEVIVKRDNKGNVIQEKYIDDAEREVKRREYVYNDAGNKIKEDIIDTDYDKNGDLLLKRIRSVTYGINGKEMVAIYEIYRNHKQDNKNKKDDLRLTQRIRQTTTYKDESDQEGTQKHEVWDEKKNEWMLMGNNRPGMARPAYGLLTTTFTTPSGKIAVNLPDDLSAGDTISGTVIAEPSGKDSEEKAENRSELNGFVVEAVPAGQSESDEITGEVLEHPRTSPKDRRLHWAIPAASVGVAMLVLRDRKGKVVDRAPVSCSVHSATPPSELQLPSTTIAGKPLVISGQFDGNASDTKVRLDGQAAEVLAESGQKCILQPPATGAGPAKLEVEKNGKTASGICRVLGIRMSAAKPVLERGESGPVNVTVVGLEGLEKPTTFVLVNRTPGLVNLSGGDWQRISIIPSQVQDGQYHHSLTMTAIRPGRYLLQVGIPGAFPDEPLAINNDNGPGLPFPPRVKQRMAQDLKLARQEADKAESDARDMQQSARKYRDLREDAKKARDNAAEKREIADDLDKKADPDIRKLARKLEIEDAQKEAEKQRNIEKEARRKLEEAKRALESSEFYRKINGNDAKPVMDSGILRSEWEDMQKKIIKIKENEAGSAKKIANDLDRKVDQLKEEIKKIK